MSATQRGPDALQLASQPMPAAAFPGAPAIALRVHIEDSAYRQIDRHCNESKTVEVCGVLVGGWKRDEGGPYVDVSASIPGEAATSRFAEVTFTHETWARINERMDREFADRMIVGWYHTHPDFGVFLSDRDVFIHQHFFSAPGQIALVVDPVRKQEGVFIWSDGNPLLAPAYWIGRQPRWAPRDHDAPKSASAEESKAPRASEPAMVESLSLPGQVTLLFGGVLLLLAGYLLGGWNVVTNEQAKNRMIVKGLAQEFYARSSSMEANQSVEVAMRSLVELVGRLRELKSREGADAEAGFAGIEQTAAQIQAALIEAGSALRLRAEHIAALDLLLAERQRQLQAAEAARAPAPDKPAKKEEAPQ